MVNIIWQDRETSVYVATHELYSRPAKLIGVVMPLAAEKSQWTTDELKAVITKYETLPGRHSKRTRKPQPSRSANSNTYAHPSYSLEAPDH
jgi:hypothetical protein